MKRKRQLNIGAILFLIAIFISACGSSPLSGLPGHVSVQSEQECSDQGGTYFSNPDGTRDCVVSRLDETPIQVSETMCIDRFKGAYVSQSGGRFICMVPNEVAAELEQQKQTCLNNDWVWNHNENSCYPVTPEPVRCEDGLDSLGNPIPPENTYDGMDTIDQTGRTWRCTKFGWAILIPPLPTPFPQSGGAVQPGDVGVPAPESTPFPQSGGAVQSSGAEYELSTPQGQKVCNTCWGHTPEPEPVTSPVPPDPQHSTGKPRTPGYDVFKPYTGDSGYCDGGWYYFTYYVEATYPGDSVYWKGKYIAVNPANQFMFGIPQEALACQFGVDAILLDFVNYGETDGTGMITGGMVIFIPEGD